MSLTAIAERKWLTVSGVAAVSGGYVQVHIFDPNLSVTDDGQVGVSVPISGDTSKVLNVDASQIANAGVSVSGSDGANQVIGTKFDDFMSGRGGSDYLVGNGGADSLYGGDGSDQLIGGRGADHLSGEAGDDLLSGGDGNDVIDGGEGTDTAVYAGAYSDYQLSIQNGAFRLADLRPGAPDGVDTLGNVEFLQFADQTVQLPGSPTLLTAAADGRLLSISGTAADPLGHVQVNFQLGLNVYVTDDGQVQVNVPISGDASHVVDIDASGIANTGVSVGGTADANRITGTRFEDYMSSLGGADRLSGFGGNDFLHGGDGADRLNGGGGADHLSGDPGNDLLIGGRGNDVIDGGDGTDTAVYGGDWSDYQLSVHSGVYQLTDMRAGSPDGVDTIGNVEFLQFADQTVDLSAPADHFVL